MSKEEFIAEMEQRFGSEAAVGLRFRMEDGSVLLAAEYDQRYAHLPLQEKPGFESLLANGGSGTCCTDYADLIYRQLPGRVQIWGFANVNNPASRIARERIHPGGHDFAVVDERYIVDPWPRLVPGVFEQMVFDLQDPAEQALVLDIYGPRACWRHMLTVEQYAQRALTA